MKWVRARLEVQVKVRSLLSPLVLTSELLLHNMGKKVMSASSPKVKVRVKMKIKVRVLVKVRTKDEFRC